MPAAIQHTLSPTFIRNYVPGLRGYVLLKGRPSQIFAEQDLRLRSGGLCVNAAAQFGRKTLMRLPPSARYPTMGLRIASVPFPMNFGRDVW